MLCRPSTPLTSVLPPPSLDWYSYLAGHHGWVVARLYMEQVRTNNKGHNRTYLLHYVSIPQVSPSPQVVNIAAEVNIALEAIR